MSEEHTAEWHALGSRITRETQDYMRAERDWAVSHSSLYNALLPEFADWIERWLGLKNQAAMAVYAVCGCSLTVYHLPLGFSVNANCNFWSQP